MPHMERRRKQFRMPADQTVQLVVLGGTEVSLIGEIENISGSGVRLFVDCPVEPGSTIQIDLGTSVLVGQVRYCQPENERFALGLELEKPVTSAADLTKILR